MTNQYTKLCKEENENLKYFIKPKKIGNIYGIDFYSDPIRVGRDEIKYSFKRGVNHDK